MTSNFRRLPENITFPHKFRTPGRGSGVLLGEDKDSGIFAEQLARGAQRHGRSAKPNQYTDFVSPEQINSLSVKRGVVR